MDGKEEGGGRKKREREVGVERGRDTEGGLVEKKILKERKLY